MNITQPLPKESIAVFEDIDGEQLWNDIGGRDTYRNCSVTSSKFWNSQCGIDPEGEQSDVGEGDREEMGEV